ncbi:MAG: ABC transporter substrate-binding protein [Alicycliphilus sp.]|jgi:iron(III) transport system substrate-binding protein|nr:ABC transporter substrate-binding protein [Alicycliphilus sp.]MBP7326331.1 ABC transporter substrate-binding protein [Alicycliphilus sp.]MBP7329946.1 ABC transporter substrate-binding protein [Alicycliphilus sp.]MBP8137838.1 ABC transporter substrate-binding protein [Alicycliphilus sp.]MBP8780553.1 ABC transporter substrate-binding protein [Alicycliphilus sp.]
MMQRPAPQLSRRTALGRLSALGCLAAAPALAQSDDELLGYAPRARPPEGYPAAYAVTVRAAEDEGQLSIHSTTDERVAMPLVADFRRLYPRIAVTYEDLGSTELYHRFIAENQLGREAADVLWSSAMDHMVALATAGHALAYASPEQAHLPAWAQWQDRLWATTYEPVVFAHHKPSLPKGDAPRSHAALAGWLARAQGSAVSYDIQKSGLGYFLAAQDAAASEGVFWATAQALGAGRARLLLTTDAMVRRIADGRARFGLNLLGAYTVAQARQRPTLGVIFPEDYTLVTSRVLLINNRTAHPNAARLWLDYLLSRRGQTVMATTARLYALREDVQGETTGAALRQLLGDRARPVALGPALSAPLANAAYGDFIARWRAALGYTKG